MDFNLDFTIESSEDRKNFIAKHDLSKLTQKELELCSNYILYGKDDGLTSVVDRKEVQIKPKFSSYSKKEPLSLDALLETPTFNTNLLQANPTIYKNTKPKIDKEKIQNIPEIKELWEQIERTQELLNNKDLDSNQTYYLKHHLIELRRQQYYLTNLFFPPITLHQNKLYYFEDTIKIQMNYPVFPRGVMAKENDPYFINPRLDKKTKAKSVDSYLEKIKNSGKPFFNFLDKTHIYYLILSYWDIKMAIEQIPDSPLHNLLWTLDFYIEKANLSPQQLLIVNDKKIRMSNKEIGKHLKKELDIAHQENYISTIWNKITQQIAAAAELNYDEWLNKDFDKAWKVCNHCGKELLRDPRIFVRKTKALDGLTTTCKICDKKKRTEGKKWKKNC